MQKPFYYAVSVDIFMLHDVGTGGAVVYEQLLVKKVMNNPVHNHIPRYAKACKQDVVS